LKAWLFPRLKGYTARRKDAKQLQACLRRFDGSLGQATRRYPASVGEVTGTLRFDRLAGRLI
jgi:hypothetical protein